MRRIVERLVKYEEWENKYGELLSKQLNEGKEVVRCGECKYGEYRADFDDYECHYSGCGLVYNADDFCSYGERREP